MKKDIIIEIISVLLIILFVYTAASKLFYYDDFYRSLLRAPLKPFTRVISLVVPTLELVTALLLLFPRFRNWGLYGSFILMTVFTLYVGYILSFAHHIPCTCGGIIQKMSWRQHLTFNSIFTLLSIIAIRLNNKRGEEIIAPYETELS